MKKESKHNTKDNYQITREQKKNRIEKILPKKNAKQLTNGNKDIHIDNYLKCKGIKCSSQKT